MNITTGWLQNLCLQIFALPADFQQLCSLFCITLSAAETSVLLGAGFLASLKFNYVAYCEDTYFTSLWRAALRVMPPMLLCWPPASELDVSSVAIEVECSCHYSITFCFCAIYAYEAKGWNWILPCRKNGTLWHLLALAELLGRHNEAVNGEFQQWWVTSAAADIYKCPWRLFFITGKKS